MSVRVSESVARGLSAELQAITKEAKIDTLAIITTTGARVAFFSKSRADSSELSAIAASLINSGGLASGKLGFGELNDVMLRGNNGFLILRMLSERFVLVGGTKNIQTFTKSASILVAHAAKISEILSDVPEDMY
ncbi:MAG: roadblock/LC7 domain-containing protein [Candidatus Heimdallarchaeota archaeon]|nr:roadblock/LC7 domain-containing protein [Candidatus Heimdallarchaeota archaeon]MDH5644434.1 roadblock/LC7 domain-containing protein [Candidatus Heimdallarchaeota archaeon]